MDIILLKKEVKEMFIRRISCWFVVIFLLISFLSGRVRTASAETIKLYDDTVTLTQVPRWAEYVIDVFLNEGDVIKFNFTVEQGGPWVRRIDMWITDKVNFSRRENSLNWSSLVSKREVTEGDGIFVAPQPGKYYFIFYNPSYFLNKNVSIEMTLIKDEKKPTFSIQTSDTRIESISLPKNRQKSITMEKDYYFYIFYTLDDETKVEIYFKADNPIDFLIMTKYDFDKIEEKGFIAYKRYQDISYLYDIFVAPTRDEYYFVFINKSPETVNVDYKLNFSRK
jgi:hypothetical protein